MTTPVDLLPVPWVDETTLGPQKIRGVDVVDVLPWDRPVRSYPRFRHFDLPNITDSGVWDDRSTGVRSLIDPYQYTSFYKRGWMLDTVTPGWQRAISGGQIINHEMHYLDRRETMGGGNVGAVKSADPTHYYWTMQNMPSTKYWWVDSRVALVKSIANELVFQKPPLGTERLVKLNCLSRVDPTPYSFLEDILEIRETLSFLSGNFTSVLKVLKRRDRIYAALRAGGFSHAKAAANAWLQLRYALRPLLISANNLALALDDKTLTRPKRQRVSATRYETDTLVSSCVHTWPASPGLFRTFEQKLDYHWKVTAGLIYEVENPIADFRYKFGLRWKDVPSAVYNIIPYTFVLDWFINFNKSIKALTNIADPNVKWLGGWSTYKTLNTLDTKLVDWSLTTGWSRTANDSDLWQRYEKEMHRSLWTPTALDAVPIPELRLDINKLVDLASLLVQSLPIR